MNQAFLNDYFSILCIILFENLKELIFDPSPWLYTNWEHHDSQWGVLFNAPVTFVL